MSDQRLPGRDATYRVQLGCSEGRWSFACEDEDSARLRLQLGVYWDPTDLTRGFYPPGGGFGAHSYWCIVNAADDALVVEVGECETCPFSFDAYDCDHPSEPPESAEHSTDYNRDSERRRGPRPDWCPLDAAPVVIRVKK